MTSQECIQRKTDNESEITQAFILVTVERESEGIVLSKTLVRVKEITNIKYGCDYLSSSALSYYGASHKIYKASTSTTSKRGAIDEL